MKAAKAGNAGRSGGSSGGGAGADHGSANALQAFPAETVERRGSPTPQDEHDNPADADAPVARAKGASAEADADDADAGEAEEAVASEEAMAAGVLAGDDLAIQSFHDTYARRLFQFFYVRVGRSRQDAEDLLQDTLVAAIHGLTTRRGESRLWTWLMSVARRKLVDFYRARARRPAFASYGGGLDEDDGTGAGGGGGGQSLLAGGARLFERLVDQDVLERLSREVDLPRLVRASITRLTPAQQDLLIGMYDEGLTVKDLADRHGLSLKAAESALYRAREAFKTHFATTWRRSHGTDHPVAQD
ncbi:MAG: RNA polymerase sigma factor [Planctomycetota bacterium]